MAETICRALRDGALEGEHAPAITIKDTLHCAVSSDAFAYFLCSLSSNIFAAKSQSQCLVLVAFDKSPSFYYDLLKSRGVDMRTSQKWLRILDCYSDPLGWKAGCVELVPNMAVKTCKNVRDVDKLFPTILELGKGVVGQSKVRFSVAVDSVSVMLRHASLSSVASLINNLRSHGQVSCIFWTIHADLHEVRATAALEYLSSMVASLEPMVQPANGQISSSWDHLSLGQSSGEGKFNVRLKRRNGRVKVMCEEFHVERSGIKFRVPSVNRMVNHNLLPKVQFNLHLSEKERADRESVVLPFEHQGNGKDLQIYDGRRSLPAVQNDLSSLDLKTEKSHTKTTQGKGEIHYLRDSDDEHPDSDEDPDDDLDI